MQLKRLSTGLFLTMLAVAILAVAPALAQGGPHGSGPHGMADPDQMMQHLMDRLDLSGEQRDQVRQIMRQSRDETRPNREAIRVGHEAMADLMHAETLDETAIRAAAEEIGAAQVELMVAHARAMGEMRRVLTPEQLDQFRQMRRQQAGMGRARGHGEGHKHGYHHGHGQPPELGEGSASTDDD